LLPAGPAGTVTLDFTPGPLYRVALIGGAVAVLVALVLLLVPVRRPGPPPARPGRGRIGLVVAAVAATALAAGPVGITALALLAYLTGTARARRRPVLGVLAAVATFGAGVLLLVADAQPFGAAPPEWLGGPARQVLGAVAVAAVVAALLPVPAGVRAAWNSGRSGTSRRQRAISGRSSSRYDSAASTTPPIQPTRNVDQTSPVNVGRSMSA
jgi:arabinofuranan 3-O-arabinosyltransferase